MLPAQEFRILEVNVRDPDPSQTARRARPERSRSDRAPIVLLVSVRSKVGHRPQRSFFRSLNSGSLRALIPAPI